MANWEISKNYSNILTEQQLLWLMYYCHLVFFLLFCLLFKRFTCYCFVVINLITIIIIFNGTIISLISIIIPQTSRCHRLIVTIVYVNVLLIFNMHDLNEALFLMISFLFLVFSWLSPSTVILPFTTIYASL